MICISFDQIIQHLIPKSSKREANFLGSSPSGFISPHEHVVCESKTRQLAKPAGLSRDHFGGAY